jgi:hypothetical protein
MSPLAGGPAETTPPDYAVAIVSAA